MLYFTILRFYWIYNGLPTQDKHIIPYTSVFSLRSVLESRPLVNLTLKACVCTLLDCIIFLVSVNLLLFLVAGNDNEQNIAGRQSVGLAVHRVQHTA